MDLSLPRIEIFAGPDLWDLEHTWRALLAQDPTATVFQTWEWNAGWWRHFAAGRRLQILIAHGPSGPLAIAPLVARRGPGPLFRRIEFMGTGVSDYLGFIGRPETMSDCVAAFLRFLGGRRRWDVIDLQQIHPGHARQCGLASGAAGLGLPWESRPIRWSMQDVCPVLALPDTWDALMRRVGKKMRFNIGYYERTLARDFDLAFDVATMDTIEPALEEFFALHAARWRRRFQPGALYSRRILDFHRSVGPSLLKRGYVALHRMRLNGRTVAALYTFPYGGRTFYYLGGFDPELARYSPGTVLNARAIRHALETGCTEFDFLRGREGYKYRWPVEERENGRLELARQESSWSLLALQWNAWQHRLEHAAKQAL